MDCNSFRLELAQVAHSLKSFFILWFSIGYESLHHVKFDQHAMMETDSASPLEVLNNVPRMLKPSEYDSFLNSET